MSTKESRHEEGDRRKDYREVRTQGGGKGNYSTKACFWLLFRAILKVKTVKYAGYLAKLTWDES